MLVGGCALTPSSGISMVTLMLAPSALKQALTNTHCCLSLKPPTHSPESSSGTARHGFCQRPSSNKQTPIAARHFMLESSASRFNAPGFDGVLLLRPFAKVQPQMRNTELAF